MSIRLFDSGAAEYTQDERRAWRARALTLVYWLIWVCAGIFGLQWPNQTVLSVWWWVLAALWLTAYLVAATDELSDLSRWLALVLVTVAGSLLMYWSAAWFLRLVSGVRLGGVEVWTLTSFAVQGLLVACLTACVVVPPLQRALGRASLPVLSVCAAFAAFRLFGHWLFSLRPWMRHGRGIAVALIELLALCLIPPALAAVSSRIRTSKPAAGHLLARLWRGELSARAVTLGLYPMTLAVMILVLVGSFRAPDTNIPRWHREYYNAIEWISTWVLVLTGSAITLRTLHRARVRRPWTAALGQLGVVMLSGVLLTVTLSAYAITAGAVFLQSTPAFLGQPYWLRLNSDGRELTLAGDAEPGLADALTASLSRFPAVSRIRLDSGGGLLDEAQDVARLIHARHLDTVVSANCSSACTVIFVAGIHRQLDASGQLGFHALESAHPQDDIYSEQLRTYALYGVGERFVGRVARVPSGSMWYPTREELIEAHVVEGGGLVGK